MQRDRPKSPRATRFRRIVISIGLALFMLGLMSVGPGHEAEANGGVCITDSITRDNIQFTLGGAYTFTQCSTGLTITGTGVVTTPNGVITLTDKKADRSVTAGLFTSQTGRAVIYLMSAPGLFQTFQANQTSPNQTCGCVPIGCSSISGC